MKAGQTLLPGRIEVVDADMAAVLVDWASDVETESGPQAFVLRSPVVAAMQQSGFCSTAGRE